MQRNQPNHTHTHAQLHRMPLMPPCCTIEFSLRSAGMLLTDAAIGARMFAQLVRTITPSPMAANVWPGLWLCVRLVPHQRVSNR